MEIDEVCCGPLSSPVPHPRGTGQSEGERDRETHRETERERENKKHPGLLHVSCPTRDHLVRLGDSHGCKTRHMHSTQEHGMRRLGLDMSLKYLSVH